MRLDHRFGDYLLFRQIGSSPLGGTYRAGRLQARAIDRVALLHCFDGEAVDGERLAADVGTRDVLLDELTAPQFAHGLGFGTQEGVPYVAYDYLLGRTLRETLGRTGEKGNAPEASYLVALVEQAAASLVAASQVRANGIPVRHGFLVPELLLLSAEGRVYPLAISHGSALLKQKALRQLFSPYLAPEALVTDTGIGDDVYSLASILFEGLTGAPPRTNESSATQVDQALLTMAGEPLRPAVQDVLKSGLSPAASRPDLKTFHRSLRQVIAETEGAPSQFQLAFFLHRLFRDELEEEAVQMRGEKTTRFDPVVLASPDSEIVPATAEVGDPSPPPPPGTAAAAAPPETRPLLLARHPFALGLAVAVLLAVGAAGFLRAIQGSSAGSRGAGRGQALTQPAGGDVENELRRLVAEGAADLQMRLEAEYEPRLSRLRKDVLAAQTAERRRSERAAVAAQATPPPEPAAPPAVRIDEEATVGEILTAVDATASDPAAPERPAAASETKTTVDEASRDAGESAAAADDRAPVPTDPSESAAEPAASLIDATEPEIPPTSSPMPEPATDQPAAVPSGDDDLELVPASLQTSPANFDSAAAGPEGEAAAEPVVDSPARLLEPPQPRYPPAAQRMRKTARVQLRVLVNAKGRVAETEMLSDPAGFGFDKAAIAAAARTRWEPARRAGVATEAWAILTIDFRL